MRLRYYLLLAALALLPMTVANATETENPGLNILPAPGKVVIDGKLADWDLTGGIFAVNDEVFELRMEPKNWGEIVFKP